ncbi:cell division inhibitor SulA [Parashewanella curva]|nr:SulA-like leucine-rich domain-containing protein [Parashewanella curva]
MSMQTIGTQHHPGLWQSDNVWQPQAINTVQTQSYGLTELQTLSPQLAQLSHQGRWLVLINPPSNNFKTILAKAGIAIDKVLLVHTKDEVETLWAMEKALTSGTSSAAICWTSSLDMKDKRRLQLITKSARAMGIIFETEAEILPSLTETPIMAAYAN